MRSAFALTRYGATAFRMAIGAKAGGEGGIRTHVPLTGQDAFEAPPLRPLRYLSVRLAEPKLPSAVRLRAVALRRDSLRVATGAKAGPLIITRQRIWRSAR